MENIIKLNQDDRLRLDIVTADGEQTGDYLVFDLEDIELPLKYAKMLEEERKNRNWLRNQEVILSKKQDIKNKKDYLSQKELERFKIYNSFYKKEVEIYNEFLGENGVEKLLHGRKMGWTRLEEINNIISTYILPKLDIKKESIINKIESIYSTDTSKEVLK